MASMLSPFVHASNQWEVRLSPYIWFAGFKGEVAPIEGLPPSHEDISASDALDDTESSFMLIAEAKKGKHAVYTDIFYSDVNSEESIDPVNLVDIESITKTTIITVGYGREIFNDNSTVVDFLVGARWWDIDATLKLRTPDPASNISADNNESWFDPFVGVKGRTTLGASKYFISGVIGYGGFGINAESFYDISANVGYQWSESIGAVFGYRQYELDYDENGFKYDVKQAGWQIGLTWSF